MSHHSTREDKNSLNDPPTPTLSGKTKVRLDLILAAGPVVFAFALLWFKMDAVQKDLQQINHRAWTVSKQSLFAEKLRGDNPGVKVPDVKQIADTIGDEQ